jgi:uncharacterized membrane protein
MFLATSSTIESVYRSKLAAPVDQRQSLVALILIIAIFTSLCVPLAYYLNIWQDEAYSLHSSQGTIFDALNRGLGFEAQAPLYFVFLAAWRDLNGSAFFARLLSVGFSIGTLLATWSFARRYLPRSNAAFVLAAVALNPFTIWAAVEIRPYAASITFSAVLLLLFFRGFVDKDGTLATRLAYLAVAIAGTYTQYYIAFLIPAHFVALLVLKRGQTLRRFIIYGVAFGFALLPLVNVLPKQLLSYHAFAPAYSVPSYVMVTVLFGYLFPHEWIDSWAHRPFENGVYLFLTFVPIVFAIPRIGPLSGVTKALLAMVGSLFLLYTGSIMVAHVHVLVPRHTLIMLVPMLATCFALISDITIRRSSFVLAAYGLIYCAFAMSSIWHDYHKMTKVGDWHRVADFVASNVKSGDGIALFNAESELPFRFYFEKSVPIFAIPRAMSFQRFDEGDFVLKSSRDVEESFGRFSKNFRRIWLIETQACGAQSAFFGCKYLTNYIQAHFTELSEARFDGTTVIELSRRPAQQSSR